MDILLQSCSVNLIPANEAFRIFMFDRCLNVKERDSLLELYTELLNLPNFDANEFERAISKKQIVNYIISVYKNHDSSIYRWFKLNIMKFLF